MAATVRVVLHRDAIRRILTSPAVAAALREVAERVAGRVRAAGVRVEHEPGDIPIPVTVAVSVGARRARATVTLNHPAGLAVEAKHRLLGRALDAGAG